MQTHGYQESSTGGPSSGSTEWSIPTGGSSSGSNESSRGSTASSDESGSGSASTGSSSTGESSGGEPCGEIHEGNLTVFEDTDLTTLSNIGRITGNLHIYMEKRDQADLSFLSCLHTVDGTLNISDNEHLDSTEGLINLKKLDALLIFENPNLQVITGFEQLHELAFVQIYWNLSLEEIHLESLSSVKFITVGYCVKDIGDADHEALVDLSGFSGLTTVERVQIDGNEVLKSADLFDALVMNGAPPIKMAWVRYNPLLPEANIHAQLDALGALGREVCGNEGGAQGCFCPIE